MYPAATTYAWFVANLREVEVKVVYTNGRIYLITKWSWTPTYGIHNPTVLTIEERSSKGQSRLRTQLAILLD